MSLLEGKKAIVIGDRDGVPGPAIEECIKAAGADVIFSSTECFVCNSRRCYGPGKSEEG